MSLNNKQSQTVNLSLTMEILASKLKKKSLTCLPKNTGESVLTDKYREDD